jgi:diaminopimelate epimerase
MHGLGNDFMVIDAIKQSVHFEADDIIALANRHTGVGFDQCLLIEKSEEPGIDFFYRIFNADGQEVGQCGNGVRCLARFVEYYGLTTKNVIKVATCTTTMELRLNNDETVTVDMGKPRLNPSDIPLLVERKSSLYTLPITDHLTHNIHAISVGNPHAVMMVPDVNDTPVSEWGPQISGHALFPEQTNAGFMQILTPQHIRLRVYERGSGETAACGSGAVAAAAVGRLYHHLQEDIKVSLPGGDLIVSWPHLDGPIFLTGPATFVYEGSLL